MTPEEHLSEVHKLAAARLRATTVAAKAANLVLVDKDRLATLEAILKLLAECINKSETTRDYADVRARGAIYNGKRFLLPRDEFSQLIRLTGDLTSVMGPAGCMVKD